MKKFYFTLVILCTLIGQNFAQFQQFIVVEENTGTWCQWCPRGTVYGEKLVHDYSNAILIAVHSGSDPMKYTDYVSKLNLPGAPSGNINRSILDSDPISWETDAQALLGGTTFASVVVSPTFNTSTREITVDVSTTFNQAMSGDYRLAAVVVEDAVTGPSPQYDQSNAYAGSSTSMGGYEDLPSSVPAYRMAYNHVARQLLSPYEGEPNTVPSSVAANSTHSHTFSYTLPAEYDEEYIRVVGMLIDQSSGAIVNAGISAYLPGHTNGKPHFITEPIVSGYASINYSYDIYARDPDNTNLTLTSANLPSWLTLTDDGKGNANLSGTPTASGNYDVTLTISDGTSDVDQTFTIVVDETPPFGWEFVGNQTITSEKTSKTVVKVDQNNVPYLLTTDDAQSRITVRKFENGNWVILGSQNFAGPTFHVDMAIGPNDNPWIVYANNQSNNIEVMEFASGQWSVIGSTGSSGVYVGIAVDNSNVPYVTFMDVNNSSRGKVISYSGGNWQPIGTGGNEYFSTSPATWHRIKLDQHGNPHVLWSDYNNGKQPTVSKFSNGTWGTIGGSSLSSDGVYFYQDMDLDVNGNIYVAFTKESNNDIDVYKYDGNTWNSIGQDISGTSTENTVLAANLVDEVYVGYLDNGIGKRSSVKNYDGQQWNFTGPEGFTNPSDNHSLSIGADGIPYLSYVDMNSNEQASVKQFIDNTTSTNDLPIEKQVPIFPNPSSGLIYFDNAKHQYNSYSLFNLQGQILLYNQRLTTSNSIQLEIPNGLYFLRLEGDNTSTITKIKVIK